MNSAPGVVLRMLRFTAFLLLGYALAGPVRLSFYFYAKPFWDLLIDGILILAAAVLALRWLNSKGKVLLVLIPLLAVSWMQMEFILFSKAEIFSVFSYLYIALWGMCFAAAWRLFRSEESAGKKWLTCLIALTLGMASGFANNAYMAILVISIAFIALLTFTMRQGQKRTLSLGLGILMISVTLAVNWGLPFPRFYESQTKFHDKVVYSYTTPFQRLDITEWKGNYWFYQDGINQFSAIDSWLYFEPFAHPAMQLLQPSARVLVVGGENGMLARELLKYQQVHVDLIPVDKAYLDLSKSLSFFTEQHEEVFAEDRLSVLEGDAFRLLNKSLQTYDAVFVDVPDPIDIQLNQYFSKEFYALCYAALDKKGLLITQSGSPYFATTAFRSIQKTIAAAGFEVQAYHNQVLSLGEWAWTIGAKSGQNDNLRSDLKALSFDGVETQWLNNEAMRMMLSFGKSYVTSGDIKVNSIKDPVIYRYYNQGNYQLQ